MQRNLLLVSLDTVRADVAYSQKFTGIERLRSRGVSFLNTISSIPLTPPSHATIFTGLQPYNHGVRHLFRESLRRDAETLTMFFKRAGFSTSAIVSCPGLNRWYGLSRGFDHYDDEIPRLPDGRDPLDVVDVKIRGTALKRADVVVERTIHWLRHKMQQPFFMFVHFFDAHWPYASPIRYPGLNPYEEEVCFMDQHLAMLIDYLDASGLSENTDIVTVSDHGEDLEGLYPNDKGGEQLGHPEEAGHGCLLYEQTQKTVLIIVSDHTKMPPGNCIEQQVRLVDVTPTILALQGIETNHMSFDGISLLPSIYGKKLDLVAYSETLYPDEQNQSTGNKYPHARNKKAFRFDNRHKIILHLGSDEIEHYDLVQDPYEQHNLMHREG